MGATTGMIEMGAPAWVLTYLFLFTMMLAIGLEVTGQQVVRALADVPPADAGAGVLILAAAPGAPFVV